MDLLVKLAVEGEEVGLYTELDKLYESCSREREAWVVRGQLPLKEAKDVL